MAKKRVETSPSVTGGKRTGTEYITLPPASHPLFMARNQRSNISETVTATLPKKENTPHLFRHSQFLLQVFDLFLHRPDLPEGILIGHLFALFLLLVLQFLQPLPQLFQLQKAGEGCKKGSEI